MTEPILKVDLRKIGPRISKRFMALVISEGPMGAVSRERCLAVAVLSTALDPKAGEEMDYALQVLRKEINLDPAGAKKLLQSLVEHEACLPEEQRTSICMFRLAVENPEGEEAKFASSILSSIGLDISVLGELGFRSEKMSIHIALKAALQEKPDGTDFLRPMGIENISRAYADMLGKKELATETVYAYTRLIVMLHSTGAKEAPAAAPQETRKPEESASKDAPASSSKRLTLEQVEARFSLPRPENRGEEPTVFQHHAERAASILGIPAKKVPDLENATNDQLLAFAAEIARALPVSERKATRNPRSLEENIHLYTSPKSEGGANDCPGSYVSRLVSLVLFYGAQRTSDFAQSFGAIREKRRFGELLKRHRVRAAKAEVLKSIADKLHDIGADPGSELFEKLMNRAANTKKAGPENILQRLDEFASIAGDRALERLENHNPLFLEDSAYREWLSQLN